MICDRNEHPDTSAAGFIAFAKKQPADEVFCYTSNFNCAYAQYLRSLGFDHPNVGPTIWHNGPRGSVYAIPGQLIDPLSNNDRTWGGLVTVLGE